MVDPKDRDVDAAFEDIVARWSADPVEPVRPLSTPRRDEPSGSGTRPEPAGHRDLADRSDDPTPEPDATPRADDARVVRSPAGHVVPPVPDEGERQQHFGWRGYAVPDEPDEDFVAPAPAPMPDPESDPQFWAIVGLLGGGGVLMIVLVVLGRASLGWLMGLAGLAMIVGFVLLVLRGAKEPKDPGDDGARV